MNAGFSHRGTRSVRCLVFLLLAAVLHAGCGGPGRPLRVGTNLWPGYEPAYLARHHGYFPNDEIQLLDFTSTSEVIRAYRNGLIDVAALTGDEALKVCNNQPDQRVILVCDYSNGADVLLAKPDIATLADLKGRRVGVETTVLGAYMLGRALESAGLRPSDVTVINVPLLEHVEAYNEGRVDAIVTFDPHRSHLLASGARLLFDSSRIPGEIVDLLLTRPELPSGLNGALDKFVSAWLRAVDDIDRDPMAAAKLLAAREGVSPDQFLTSLQGLKLINRKENAILLGDSEKSLKPILQRLSERMLEQRLTAAPVAPPVLDPAYLPAGAP